MKLFAVAILLLAGTAIKAQDESINNLVLPANYQTGEWGQLGEVKLFGKGDQDVILIPGWGFDYSIFSEFIRRHENEFTMFAITIPGFGGTPAPPMPADNEVYSNLHWTKGVVKGILSLIENQKLDKPVIVSCFTYSNLVAMRLALDHPEKIGKLVMIGGSAKFTPTTYPSLEPRTLQEQINYIDNLLSKKWFKMVTRETWDKGNFHPVTFTKDSTKAKQHWQMMSSVSIPVMVRYLCESYCMDLSFEYKNLAVPALVVVPAFSPEVLSDAKYAYLIPFFHNSWLGARPASKNIQITTIQDSHTFVMDDQPEKLDAILSQFLLDPLKPVPPLK